MEVCFGGRIVRVRQVDSGFCVEPEAENRIWAPVVGLLGFGVAFTIVAALQVRGVEWMPAHGMTEEEFAVLAGALSEVQALTLRSFAETQCGLASSS